MSRQLKDWGIIAANASASMSLRVWDRDQALVGIFTVTCPQVATFISNCVWNGAGWLDSYFGAEVISITNGDIFTGPMDDITKLTTTSGEKLIVGYGLGVSGLDDQSKLSPYTGSTGGGTWGSVTGTLSAQTDLQAALDLKAASSSLGTASTHPATDFPLVANNLSDLANAATARTNLGLGSAATHAASDFASAGASGLTFGQALIIANLGI